MEETPKPSIADLWAVFSKMKTGPRWSTDWHEFEGTRQRLLDGCNALFGKHESYTEFEIVADEIWATYRDCDGARTSVGRVDTVETALEMSAAYAFMAWELKQRKSETDGRAVAKN